jgi:glycosyltransferase involved in cell wall biosynthesis
LIRLGYRLAAKKAARVLADSGSTRGNLSRILDDSSERAQRKARALKRAAGFSWEKAARKTSSAYFQAAKEK